MKLTSNLLNNQNYVLGERDIRIQQNKYLINYYQYLFHEELFIEKVALILLVVSTVGVIGYTLYPNLVVFYVVIILLGVFETYKLYKFLILFLKKVILSDKFLGVYFKKQRNRIKIIKNSIEFNTYLYKKTGK